MTMKLKFAIFIFVSLALQACSERKAAIEPCEVIPTWQQVEYQQMELIGFLHFSINTFTGKEWGLGDESPTLYNPSELDVEQWCRIASNAGMKQLILTAKHHDGFCLWPSTYTEHSVRNSPWKEGNGDLVREFTDACRKHGLKAGLYLSPWDRNHEDYGTPAYIDYYRKQLTELLTNYGTISEIWFDGANGGYGYYGGAYEDRVIDRKTYYDWDSTIKLVYSHQPDIIIFSDAGPGCRWIGNENGIAGETNWSTINGDSLIIGASKKEYLNTGDPDGKDWIVGECDVSIRPGWFYHAEQNDQVKSLDKLREIYLGSVGRNGVLLLNIPPDKRGLIHKNDEAKLLELAEYVKETFKNNLAQGAITYTDEKKFIDHQPSFLFDDDMETFWAVNNDNHSASLVIELPESQEFNLVMLGEYIPYGQRVERFNIEAWENDEWVIIAEGTTIGYKRILETTPRTNARLKLNILQSKADPLISTFGLYYDKHQQIVNHERTDR
jgi:alpha-L-fucosidase